MHKLAGLDAGFLYNETPRAPQHIASVQVLELPDERDPDAFIAELKALLVRRAHLVPYFTNKLQQVPWQLDHPVWVRDQAFDIDRHVIRVEVPAPGGRAEFEATIAELHATPLDRNRPLWQLCVLTGLQCGCIAYYNRVHHACLDGVSGQAAVEAIMDPTPEVRTLEAAPASFHTRPAELGPLALLSGAIENLMQFQVRQATQVLGYAETARRLLQRAMDPGKGLGALLETAPRTRFNHPVEARRSYATGELPLAEVRSIGKAVGASVNDVFMAICSGALRSYLDRIGELPDDAMIAGCPVSLRQPGDASNNNQVTMMMVNLASNEADPYKRLLKISRSSAQAKGVVAAMAGSYDSNVALPGMPGMMSAMAQWLDAGSTANYGPARVPCNLVISNVPGPREQLYCLGAKMLTHYPVSIPTHYQGMNITVQSYTDQLFFGITACAQALPDAASLRNDMLAAFVELRGQVFKAPAVLAPREKEVSERLLPPLGQRQTADFSQSRAA